MKRLILLITILCTFTAGIALASGNFLNSVILEGTETGYNVVLRSDARAKIKKSIKSRDNMVLTLYGTTVSDDINTLYKNTTDVNSIIVDSAPLAVGDRFAKEKMLWAGFSVMFLLLMIHSIKSQNRRIVRKMNMRDREIEFYKATIPSINYKVKNKYSAIPAANNARTLRQFQNLTKI